MMKALIIDDEKHVREGLVLLAEWDKYGIDTILEAGDGDEAIQLIMEHQPEIIFTDMRMPKKDGISLLKWIHSANLNSKTIVVSGYDDFEYMRNAIYYKSFDYILKPIDPEILNETLDRAVTEWKEQALFRKSQIEEHKVMNEVKQLYWDRLFSGLLHKTHISDLEVEKIQNQFSIDIRKESLKVALIQVNFIMDYVFEGDTDLCFFSLNNICNEKLGNSGVSFRNLNKECELVLVFWNHRHLTFLLEQIHSSIYQFTKAYCTFSLGEQASELKDAYQSALHVFKKRNLVEKKKIVTLNDIASHDMIHLLHYAQEFMWAIKSGSSEQIDAILLSIFQPLEKAHSMTIEQVQDWENQFEYFSQNVLKEYEIDERIDLYKGLNYWNEDGTFSFPKFKEEKKKEFQDLIQKLIDVKYQKEKNSIQHIEAYLRQHYQEDINLQKISDRFFLSREYISRKFKQEYHETLTDYLTKIRMEKAKELLENQHLKIYEIAYNVGYQNEKYFSKVFKKFVGVTPNEYRNSLQAK